MEQLTTIRVTKWGNSLGIRIPKNIARSINVEEGTELIVNKQDELLILKRRSPKLKYCLEELLDKITPENQHAAIDWGAPRGNEIW